MTAASDAQGYPGILIALALAALLACKASDEEKTGGGVDAPEAPVPSASPEPPPAGPLQVTLDIQVPTNEEGPHYVTAATNLPDGTELMFSIDSKSVPGDSYQSKAVVRAGQAKAGPFGKGGRLPLGQYEADVTMPIAAVQPPEVQRIIGKDGARLTGPLVEKGELGVTVGRVTPFKLGGESAPRVDDAADRARKLLREVEALEKSAQAMAPLRKTRDNDKLRKCGELMRKYQPEAERMRDATQELPTGLGMHIGIAAGHLVLCTSCLDSAEDSCRMARQSVKDAKQALEEAR